MTETIISFQIQEVENGIIVTLLHQKGEPRYVFDDPKDFNDFWLEELHRARKK